MRHPEPGEEYARWFYCKDCNDKFLVVGWVDCQEHDGYCDGCRDWRDIVDLIDPDIGQEEDE